jgi:hypothetical protein
VAPEKRIKPNRYSPATHSLPLRWDKQELYLFTREKRSLEEKEKREINDRKRKYKRRKLLPYNTTTRQEFPTSKPLLRTVRRLSLLLHTYNSPKSVVPGTNTETLRSSLSEPLGQKSFCGDPTLRAP